MDLGVMMKSSMTAMNRYRMMTQAQTAMMNSTAKVGFEVRCFLRLRSRLDVAFRMMSLGVTLTQPASSPTTDAS